MADDLEGGREEQVVGGVGIATGEGVLTGGPGGTSEIGEEEFNHLIYPFQTASRFAIDGGIYLYYMDIAEESFRKEKHFYLVQTLQYSWFLLK